MASPLRPEVNEPRPPGGPVPPRRRFARRARFVWWVIFWVAILILALWWAIWGWAGTGGWWWAGRTRTQPAATPQTSVGPATSGTGLGVLGATDKHPYIGKYFQADNIPVQRVVNQNAIWIGTVDTKPMLLILSGSGSTVAKAGISKGSLVDVIGTVEKAPPAAQARKLWPLSSSGVTRLEQQGAEIQAKQIYAVHNHP